MLLAAAAKKVPAAEASERLSSESLPSANYSGMDWPKIKCLYDVLAAGGDKIPLDKETPDCSMIARPPPIEYLRDKSSFDTSRITILPPNESDRSTADSDRSMIATRPTIEYYREKGSLEIFRFPTLPPNECDRTMVDSNRSILKYCHRVTSSDR